MLDVIEFILISFALIVLMWMIKLTQLVLIEAPVVAFVF